MGSYPSRSVDTVGQDSEKFSAAACPRERSSDDRGVERLVVVLADRLVELGAGLHLGRSCSACRRRARSRRRAPPAPCWRRAARTTGQITIAVAHRLELGGGEERRAAELGHVGEQRHARHRARRRRGTSRRWSAPRGRSRRRRPRHRAWRARPRRRCPRWRRRRCGR